MANSEQHRRVEDRLRQLIEPLIPPRPVPRGPGERSRIADRAAREEILFMPDTVCRGRDVPEGGLRVRAHRLAADEQVAGRWCLGRSRAEAVVLWVFKVLRVTHDDAWIVVENLAGGTAKCSTVGTVPRRILNPAKMRRHSVE